MVVRMSEKTLWRKKDLNDAGKMPAAPEAFIRKTEKFVHALCSRDCSGHDWWHVYRVRKMALKIAREEKADLFIVELAALLHDVDDWKVSKIHEPVKARKLLHSLGLAPGLIARICAIIEGISFRGAGVPTPMSTLEGKCVQDADRLDALGAIGIARTFAYGGSKGRPIHDPAYKPRVHASFEEYKKSVGTTIGHFYEKLLLLKDLMQTRAGRRLANERHACMEEFLARFLAEWEGLE
jgi:uncharacterized protein